MSFVDFELEERLRHWAKWEYNLRVGNIGYPTKSIIVAFAEGGINLRYPSTSICPLLKFSEAQEVGLWLVQLGKEHKHEKDAISLYYLTSKRIRELADGLNISTRTFKQRLHDAKLWLSGRLSAKEK